MNPPPEKKDIIGILSFFILQKFINYSIFCYFKRIFFSNLR